MRANPREAWFRRCVDAVGNVVPNPERAFLCPICLAWIREIEDVTFEHAPPKSVGGRRVALTCRDCNSTAGHSVDAEMRGFENVVDLSRKTLEKPMKVSFGIGGAAMTATATSTDRGIQIVGMPEATDPKQHAAVVEFFGSAARDHTTGTAMKLTFPRRWTVEGVRAGWIRAEYLAAFATFGYRYIARSQLDVVRDQIRNPTVELMPRGVMVDFRLPPSERGLWIIERPRTLSSVLVGMGRFAVFLGAPVVAVGDLAG